MSDRDLPLPHELLLLVLGHLSKNDIKTISQCNRALRRQLKPYLFNQVVLDWGFIRAHFKDLFIGKKRDSEGVVVLPLPDDTGIKHMVEKITIEEPNLQYEWNFQFGRMIKQFHNLTELTLCIQGSSNFLKYNEGLNTVTHLSLITASDSGTFNLDHCKQFTSLKKLICKGFTLDFDIEDTLGLPFELKELELVNCSWNYPFQLKNFGPNIVRLQLIYQDHQFMLSERFREFLHNPHFPRLQELTISNQSYLNLHITYKIMNFLKNIPMLQRLYLLGKISNETLDGFTKEDLENRVRYVLNVNDVKIFYSSFVKGV